MKHTLTALLALALVGLGQCQTLITGGASGDAVGPSIAVFVSEGSSDTIIRIAYLDGSSAGSPGTNLHIRDYDSEDMSFKGSRTINIGDANSPKFTKPRLSRDGRGVVFFGSVNDGQADDPSTPFYAELSDSEYSGTGSVNAVAAPYAGIDGDSNLGSSVSLFQGYDFRPPAISNIDEYGDFHIIFEDLWPEMLDPCEELYTPLMYWNTGSGVGDISSTNNFIQPAISGSGDDLVYVSGNQVKHADGGAGSWLSGTVSTVSRYNSTDGNAASVKPEVDGSGDVVVFVTSATNLRASDTNNMRDVYTWTSGGGPVLAYSDPGSFFQATIDNPSISPDGAYVGFESKNENFDAGNIDYSERSGVYAYRVHIEAPPVSVEIVSYAEGTPVIARYGLYPAIANSGRTVFMTSDTGIVEDDDRAGVDIIYRG